MRTPLFKNREYRLIFTGIIVLFLVVIFLQALYTKMLWSNTQKTLIIRDLALLGSLLSQQPSENDVPEAGKIIQSFTGELTSEDIESGAEIAAVYGYTTDLPLNALPLLNSNYLRSQLGFIILYTVLAVCVLLLLSFVFSSVYRRLHALSLGAERVMRSDFTMRFPENGEGELPLLGYQFNQLSNRLQQTFDVEQAEKKLLKEMVSGISHQLKTPLSSTRMFTELLLEGAETEPAVREEFLQKSLSQLERMEWLISSLLKMSRLEAGVITLNRQDHDLTVTVQDVTDNLTMMAKQKNQVLKLHILPVHFLHDAKWLAEAVENVIKNAILYTPEGGTITVSLFEGDATLGLVVQDNGPGIPKDELPRIFERFYQGRSSTGARKGSGIGLALARLIVEMHGGVIHAISSDLQGATFTLTFPKIAGPM